LKEGDNVELSQEATNTYDRFAIQINFQERNLGYIPAFEDDATD
jgi:hypothetical protein